MKLHTFRHFPRRWRVGRVITVRDGKGRVMRILVAVNPRMYGEVLLFYLRQHRPEAEVKIARLEHLDAEAASFEPHLVLCSDPTPAVRTAASWVELSKEDGLAASVHVDSRAWDLENISMSDILKVVDETQKITA